MHSGHVAGATLIGARITNTQGTYPAELQAIARVLAMFPINVPLEIHTDSQASLKAIESYEKEHNERKRLRMASLHSASIDSSPKQPENEVEWLSHLTHVRAYHWYGSVGNRLADYQVNLARPKADPTYPLNLQPLPLERCEFYLGGWSGCNQ